MKNSNTVAAIVLALGMVISSCIMYLALHSLGQDIKQAAIYAKPDSVRVPNLIHLNPTSLTVRLANSPGGSALKIDSSDKNK